MQAFGVSTSQRGVGQFHAKPQFNPIWCLVDVLRAAVVSDGPAYSGLVSSCEGRLDLCLKRPSFYCLIHFYEKCVSSLARPEFARAECLSCQSQPSNTI